jgi:cell division initiation protein
LHRKYAALYLPSPEKYSKATFIMKITPIEIRQKTFEKVFRGYDKEEVASFLQIISDEWIKMNDEAKSLEIRLESAEKEIAKLREVESSLYKTLKTAEDTGANMVEQANKAAELQMKETQMKADNMVSDARSKAGLIIDNAEKRARDIISKMLTEIKSLENNFNAAITLKENLLSDLTNLSSATLERAQKFKKQKDKLDIEKYIKEAREFAENYDLESILNASKETDESSEDKAQMRIGFGEEPEKAKKVAEKQPAQRDEADQSFFDLLE